MRGRLGVHRTVYFVYGSVSRMFSFFSVLCALFLFSNFTVFLFSFIFHAERFLSWNQLCSANNFMKKIAKNVSFPKHRLFLKFSEMKISDLSR